MNYKVGDIVVITDDDLAAPRQKGRILYIVGETTFGIDFSEFNYSSIYLHDLQGRLPERTGRWYLPHQITLYKKSPRKKTGFGQFISRIEAT